MGASGAQAGTPTSCGLSGADPQRSQVVDGGGLEPPQPLRRRIYSPVRFALRSPSLALPDGHSLELPLGPTSQPSSLVSPAGIAPALPLSTTHAHRTRPRTRFQVVRPTRFVFGALDSSSRLKVVCGSSAFCQRRPPAAKWLESRSGVAWRLWGCVHARGGGRTGFFCDDALRQDSRVYRRKVRSVRPVRAYASVRPACLAVAEGRRETPANVGDRAHGLWFMKP